VADPRRKCRKVSLLLSGLARRGCKAVTLHTEFIILSLSLSLSLPLSLSLSLSVCVCVCVCVLNGIKILLFDLVFKVITFLF
jgi:hypothetical protein